MRQRLVGILPFIVLYSLLAGYVLAAFAGAGAQDSSAYRPIAIGDDEIRLGHGPLDETAQTIDELTDSDDDDETAF